MSIHVKMKRTTAGSNTGATVRDYVEGQKYWLSEDLAHEFIRTGMAVKVRPARPAAAKRRSSNKAGR